MSYVDDVFGAGGLLAKKFPGYAPRKGQIDMANAVEDAYAGEKTLLVEGPTGTGKGLAYLVPAIHNAVTKGRRVLVVTENIALQEQLVGKDLPTLAGILPHSFTFALLKGRSNYLCADRLEKVESEEAMSGDPEINRLREWAHETIDGDKNELPVIPSASAWAKFSVSANDCKGRQCAKFKACFAETARARAKRSQIIVANYHLLFTHLLVKMKTGQDLVLPPFDTLIADEAHGAADIAREYFGFRVGPGTIRHAGRELGDGKTRKALTEAADAYFAGLLEHRRSKAYKARLREPAPVEWAPLHDLLVKTAKAYQSQADDRGASGDTDGQAKFRNATKAAANAAASLREGSTFERGAGPVYYVDVDERDVPWLASKVVDVAPMLRDHLWPELKTVILTSATLTVGGKFDHIARELGVGEARGELIAESPFDWRSQAMLVVPQSMPDPKHPSYDGATHEAVRDVVRLASGRTLAIFTSRRNLDAAHRVLVEAKTPFRIMKQGERPRTFLVDEFRRDVSSVLLGTKSFWTGVDVSGEALSCVVIDRLPFPSPDDPVADAVNERDPDAFFNYFVPRAVTAFKQGFGRLIRSTTDRGVVVLLDKRILTKGYGRTFLKSLPAASMSMDLADVGRFLGPA